MERKRVGYIDLLRVISAFAVMMIHVVTLSSISCRTLSPERRQMLENIHSLLRWSVPVFCMITGFLFLGKKRDCTYRSIAKNIVRLVLLLVFTGGFYSLLEQVYTAKHFLPEMLPRAVMDILTGNLWDHMWYLYMIIGVYLMLPVIAPFFEKNIAEIGTFCAVSFLLTILLPDASKRLGFANAFSLPIAGYSFYVIMGGFLGQIRYRVWHLWIAAAGLVAAVILLFSPLYEKSGMNYLSVPVALMAVSIFVIFGICFSRYHTGRIVRTLAVCSGGIYLLHPLFLNLQIKVLGINPLDYPAVLSVPFNCVIIFGISAIGVYLIKFIIANLFMKGV